MKRNNLFDFILLLFSVIFLSLCQPSFIFEDGCSFFAWFAYIPFFILSNRLSIKASFLWGAAFGFLFCAFLCPWLSEFGLIALFFVCGVFAFYNSILFFMISFFRKNISERGAGYFWILRVFSVLAIEYVRTKGMFAFSYGIIAYSQWKIPAFLKFSSFFGVWGVSFLILLLNSLLAKMICEKNFLANLKKFAFCLSLVFSVFIFEFFSSCFSVKKSPSRISFALIQNASSASSHNISDYERDFLLLQKLTDDAFASCPQTKLVVWPETAIVPDFLYFSENSSDKRRHELSKNLISYIKSKNSSFVIGTNHREGQETFNSAVYFSPKEQNFEVYNKNNLVPFTEYWPSFLAFKFFARIKTALNCELFEKGNGVKFFSIDGVDFAVPICFEDSFSSFIRKMKKNGADFFVNITDDAWASSEAARNMHLSMSAFRAAEYYTPFVRSSIDGKTCAIDSNGKVVSKIPSATDGFLCGNLEVTKNTHTVYFLIGDAFIILITIFVFALLLILSVGFVKVNVYGRR